MKKYQITLFFISFLSGISACAKTSDPGKETAALPVLAPESELTVTSSKEQVEEFEKIAGFTELSDDECFNITPDFVREHSEFQIFKYAKWTDSFLMYEGEVYSIGNCFGGYGITSMALADLNGDGQYELYDTFSWGSGIPRSQIGYFDPAEKEVTIFDYSFDLNETMLTTNDSGELCINIASPDFDTCVDFSVRAEEQVGTVVFREGEIVLDIDDSRAWRQTEESREGRVNL